jgi:hypothetical protein
MLLSSGSSPPRSGWSIKLPSPWLWRQPFASLRRQRVSGAVPGGAVLQRQRRDGQEEASYHKPHEPHRRRRRQIGKLQVRLYCRCWVVFCLATNNTNATNAGAGSWRLPCSRLCRLIQGCALPRPLAKGGLRGRVLVRASSARTLPLGLDPAAWAGLGLPFHQEEEIHQLMPEGLPPGNPAVRT